MKRKESARAASLQDKEIRLEKYMGQAPTGHLKEINELEISIDTSQRDECKEGKQRERNNKRSAIERTRKVEKKERLNRE